MKLPRFNEARGETASMQLIPPFHFTGVTMRVFPLRANRYLLQRFIDQQLNIIPPDAGQFRVFLPYIYLIIVNYGRMSVEAANLGWISQNEVAFSVPLIWRRKQGGQLIQDFAYVSPFIYVDNPLSMTTGREVYGWPKMMAGFDPQLSAWMASPMNRIQQASMSVDVIRDAYVGARATRATLLEVDSAPIPTFAQVPFDVRNPLMPWNSTRKAIYTSSALFADSVEIFRGMLEEFLLGPGREGIAGQLERALQSPASLLALNTVNLKQFRDAAQPDRIAYQAVTNTPMTVKSFRRGGMLGDLRALAGDVTGGYRIRIHNYDTQPIIGSLGLEVESHSEIEGSNVSNLAPVFPFWLELDLEYPLASILAFRQKGSRHWFYGEQQSQIEVDDRFNTAKGAGGAEIAGPFSFPDATVRVLPLLADPDKLQTFIDAYLNHTLADTSPPASSRFVAWGRYVYMIVLSDDGAFSESNYVGELATRQAGIFVPVKWYEGERLVSTALVPVYSYANSAVAAISSSSVNGIPTMAAELLSPPNSWLGSRGPSPVAPDEMMVLRGEVLPVLNLGQQATTRTILECDNREPVEWEDVQGWRRLADRWAPPIRREHARKREVSGDNLRDGKTLALELLANGGAFTTLTLKQFRDAADPQRGCYQAIVAVPMRIEQLFELEEIEGPLHVRVHEYPSQAIVSTLGLLVKDWTHGGGSQIAVLEPCRPFWLRARMRQDLGTNVHVWRPSLADTPTWTAAPPFHTLLSEGPRLGPDLVDQIEDGVPQYLAGHATRWLDAGGEALAVERAQAAVEALEPQQVIESVLACEWEAWLDPRWWRGHQHVVRRLEEATASAFPSEVTKKTAAVLHEICQILRDEQRPLGISPVRFRPIVEDLELYEDLASHLAEVQAADELLQTAAADAPARRKAADARLVRHLHRSKPAAASLFDQAFEVFDDVFEDAEQGFNLAVEISEDDRRALVAAVRGDLEDLRVRIIRKLAKSWQKPDSCVRRQTVLRDGLEMYFPASESFDAHWHAGLIEPIYESLATAADRVARHPLLGVTPDNLLAVHEPHASPFWRTLPGSGAIKALSCLPDGTLVGVGMDNALWTRASLTTAWVQVPSSQSVYDVTVLADGRLLGIGTNFELYVRPTLRNASWTQVKNSGAVQGVTALADGRIAAAGRDGRLMLRDNLDAPWRVVDDTLAITRVCALANGYVLGVGPNRTLHVRERIDGSWQAIGGAEGMVAVASP